MKLYTLAAVLIIGLSGCGDTDSGAGDSSNAKDVENTLLSERAYSLSMYPTDINAQPDSWATYKFYVFPTECTVFSNGQERYPYFQSFNYCSWVIENKTISFSYSSEPDSTKGHKTFEIIDWYNKDTNSFKVKLYDDLYIMQID